MPMQALFALEVLGELPGRGRRVPVDVTRTSVEVPQGFCGSPRRVGTWLSVVQICTHGVNQEEKKRESL